MGTAKYRYRTNRGNVFYARTDSDTELQSIRGNPPTEQPVEGLTFKYSKNAKEVGGSPRVAILSRVIGTENENNCIVDVAQRFKYVAVLTQEHAATLQPEVTKVTVDRQEYIFKGISEEQIR
jgi:hypothetical protein